MRVDRLLSILMIISNKGVVTGKDLAEHFEVSLRTIYRDIDKIGEAGIPIASQGGKGGGFYIMQNYNLDNLFLNKGQLHTLMTVLNSLDVLFGKNQQFNDILLKCENSYKEEKADNEKLTINISHFSMEEELKEYLSLMNEAIEENKLLIFDYINRNMDYSQRTAEPIQINFSHGQWYLTAFCRNRNSLRKFKLVRIRNLRMGDSFIPRNITKEDMDRAFKESYQKKSIKVKMKFSSKIGEQLTEYFTRDRIKTMDDGSFIVEDRYPYEEGLFKFILGFGQECEVIEPQDLREEVREYLEKIQLKYSSYI